MPKLSSGGTKCICLEGNLKITKQALKRWNLEEFGNLKKKKKDAQLEMNSLDLSEEERSLGEEEKTRKIHLQGEFWRLAKLNESLLIKKSRIWTKEGDYNLKIFPLHHQLEKEKE